MASVGRLARCRLPAIIRRCEEDGEVAWVAECVPLGVVTQGDTLLHALDMLVEAVDLVIDDDLGRGVDPLETRHPSDEVLDDWQRISRGFPSAATAVIVDVVAHDVRCSRFR